MRIVIHCFPFGNGAFLKRKMHTKMNPPMNCRTPAICKAGAYVTACFDASHVVPHATLTHASANIAFVRVLASRRLSE